MQQSIKTAMLKKEKLPIENPAPPHPPPVTVNAEPGEDDLDVPAFMRKRTDVM